MAKFFRCWVIVSGSVPTAFRAREPEELLPTLKQLQRTQPDVTLKWFERGRLWTSPEAAKQALVERRRTPNNRGRDWRPGGEHKDPRAKYDIPRDEKRARFKKRLITKKTHGAGPVPRGPRPDAPTGDRPKRPFRPDRPDSPFRKDPPFRQDRPFRPEAQRRSSNSWSSDRTSPPAPRRPLSKRWPPKPRNDK